MDLSGYVTTLFSLIRNYLNFDNPFFISGECALSIVPSVHLARGRFIRKIWIQSTTNYAIKFSVRDIMDYVLFFVIEKENRRTIVQRWPTEIQLNLKPAFHLIKGEAGKKGRSLWRTSNQSRQKDQQEFTSTCGNFLFDQEKPCRKREGWQILGFRLKNL